MPSVASLPSLRLAVAPVAAVAPGVVLALVLSTARTACYSTYRGQWLGSKLRRAA